MIYNEKTIIINETLKKENVDYFINPRRLI